MKTIILHYASKKLTYLIPIDSINYIVEDGAGTMVFLKYSVAGHTHILVDETIDDIWGKI